jgi:hypothetical protein
MLRRVRMLRAVGRDCRFVSFARAVRELFDLRFC